MRLITIEDFRDIYLKTIQRGSSFVLSKFSLNKYKRTKSAFNEVNISSAHWWIIPEIHSRWNKLITGSEEVGYEEYISKNIFTASSPLRLISIGSGVCSHETLLAQLNPEWQIQCIDFSETLIEAARKNAQEKSLKNIQFIAANIYEYSLPENHFDIVLFHQSLHHFSNIRTFIPKKVLKTLNSTGQLVIHEYVGPNRLQYPKNQIKAISQCLQATDKRYRQIFKSRFHKNHYYGSGLLRMIVSDPSECVDSENILPTIYQHFDTIYEKHFGGNILMCALKDISHHFVEMDEEKKKNLYRMIDFEDNYLLSNKSDFVFGIYRRKQH